jgi:hypothetical protein
VEKLYIYGGITLGGIIGSYLPVWLFKSDPIGPVSIVGGLIGGLAGLYFGYKAAHNFGD